MKLLVLSAPESPELQVLQELPQGVELVHTAHSSDDAIANVDDRTLRQVEVLLLCGVGPKAVGASDVRALLPRLESLKWIHTASAGVNHLLFDELVSSDTVLTNARGVFSNSLAEYALMACKWFALGGFNLIANKKEHNWAPFDVEELRDATMGVVGYGDIGQTCAKLAKAFKMRVIATRRRPELCKDDPLCDAAYPPSQLNSLMKEADYVVVSSFWWVGRRGARKASLADGRFLHHSQVALPLTPQTEKFVDEAAINSMQSHATFVNIGRGTCVDEGALIRALEEGRIRGAALDVFEREPLPPDSPLWSLGNVFISPHNADRTAKFQHESLGFFVRNVGNFLQDGTTGLQNVVDKQSGY